MPGPLDHSPPVVEVVPINGGTTPTIVYPREPDRWIGPWRSRTGGLGADAASVPPRQLNVPMTVWGNVIPWVFGSCRVPAYCGAVSVIGGVIRMGLIFAHGEQASIATLLLGGDATPGEMTVRTHVGDGTALSGANTGNILNSSYFTGWSAAHSARWASLCHAAVQFGEDLEVPSLTFTALLGGHKFQDWLGGAAAAHTNPAKVAYFIFKSSTFVGDLSARLDTGVGGTWRRFADWCDETVSGNPRYEFVGSIAHRKAANAIAEVLNHGLASTTLAPDGLVKIWASMPPPSITGTWSAAATTTITGASGAATTDLAEDDFGYFQGYWSTYGIRQVTAVNGVNEFVIDGAAVTIAAGTKFRRLQHGGVHLTRHDLLKQPVVAGVNPAEVPDAHRVKWVYPVDGGDDYRDYPDGGSPTKRTETTLTGCPGAAMATRYAETVYQLAQLANARFEGAVDKSGKAAQLDVGDVLLIDFAHLTRVAVQMLPPRGIRYEDNTIVLGPLVRFDGAAYSEGTDTDTPPVDGVPGWGDAPTAVSACAYAFAYVGASARLATYHDAIGSWGTQTAVTVTADAASGPTGLSDSGGGTADKVEATSASAVIAGPGAVSRAGTPVERAFVWLRAVTDEDSVRISTDNAGEREVFVRDWWRWYPAGGGAAGGTIRVELSNGAARPDLYVCGAGSFMTSGDWLYRETMTWTAPSSTAGILAVALEYQTASGGQWIEHGRVPVSVESLSWGTAADADFGPLPISWYDWRLVTLGYNRQKTAFPDPATQNYSGSTTNRQSPEGSKYHQLSTGEVLQVGDPAGGSYLETDEDGVQVLVGTVVHDDIQIGGLATCLQGGRDPELAQLDTDGAGSVGLYQYRFPANTPTDVFFTMPLNLRYRDGTDVLLHVQWEPDTTEASTSVVWELEYVWKEQGVARAANTTVVTYEHDGGVGGFTAGTPVISQVATISGSGRTPDSVLMCRLTRLTSAAADDYAGKCWLDTIDARIVVDKWGHKQ